MISKEEVQRIAKLARLELTDEEIEKMQKDLSSILDYFEVLKKAQKSELKAPARSATDVADGQNHNLKIKTDNVVRKDEAVPKNHHVVNKLIEAAPEKKERYIKVKTVF